MEVDVKGRRTCSMCSLPRAASLHAAAVAWTLAAALSLAGCDDDGPAGPGDGPILSREITVEQLADAVGSIDGPSRVEIELLPGSDVAEEVELKRQEETAEEEELEGRAVAFASEDCPDGALTLAVGAFEVDVRFDGSTEFEVQGDDSEDDLSCEEFVARVRVELDAGRTPRLEAERPAMNPAQAPDDAIFLASELELDAEDGDDDEDDEIEINIDDRHVTSTGDGNGTITVLGLEIQLRDGITEVEEKGLEEVEFEGLVACAQVDVASNTFALTGGTRIRIDPAVTEIDADDGDEEELGSLEEVRTACDAGSTVEAEGEGIADPEDSGRILATEVEFELDDDDDDDDDDDG